jgi:hypothetical protein
MTPREDQLRRAFREKADEVPVDMVQPLLLLAHLRRSSSLANGGGQRTRAPAWLAPAVSAALVAAVISGSVAVSRIVLGAHAAGRLGQGAATSSPSGVSSEAAGWVAAQVSRSVVVSCDPVMCHALKAHGIPARDLDVLGPGTAGPLRSQVIVATAAVRREFGSGLSSVYAPAIIASFGSGNARTDVRVIAPGGAAAYRSALSADLASRKAAGAQLLRSPRIRISAAAGKQLLAGHVDSRLLIAIVTISGQIPVSIVAFGDPGPGAGAGSPLRFAELAGTENTHLTGSSSNVAEMLTFLDAQRPPYAPAWAAIARPTSGQPVLRVEFAAPGPLGLLAGNGA